MLTAYEAVSQYRETFQRIISCFTSKTVKLDVKGGYYPADDPYPLTCNEGLPFRLAGPWGVHLLLRQSYCIVSDPNERNSYRVSTVEYSYGLRQSDGSGIVRYDWHPETTPAQTYPHLHVEAVRGFDQLAISERTHLRTGRVAIEDILRMAVEEFGVTPVRDDWEAVLRETQAQFERDRTWSGSEGKPSTPSV